MCAQSILVPKTISVYLIASKSARRPPYIYLFSTPFGARLFHAALQRCRSARRARARARVFPLSQHSQHFVDTPPAGQGAPRLCFFSSHTLFQRFTPSFSPHPRGIGGARVWLMFFGGIAHTTLPPLRAPPPHCARAGLFLFVTRDTQTKAKLVRARVRGGGGARGVVNTTWCVWVTAFSKVSCAYHPRHPTRSSDNPCFDPHVRQPSR